jgi:hypothetical protein
VCAGRFLTLPAGYLFTTSALRGASFFVSFGLATAAGLDPAPLSFEG